MAQHEITGLKVERVRANLARIREEIAAAAKTAGRDADDIELLVAVKYVPVTELEVLADAGITLLGENRAQQLEKKATSPQGGRFSFDFIGTLQSRKVKSVLQHVRLIHSVCTDSALEQLAKHADSATEVLVQVNVAGEESKAGIPPEQVSAFIERCPVQVGGLMIMPPATSSPQANRRYFAKLRELAEQHGLQRLSMGTSQDFAVAVEEGATLVRVGSALFA